MVPHGRVQVYAEPTKQGANSFAPHHGCEENKRERRPNSQS